MNYQSTRGRSGESLSSAQIIKQGLALDGGLFIPESIPTLTLDEIKALCSDSYPERAAKILAAVPRLDFMPRPTTAMSARSLSISR